MIKLIDILLEEEQRGGTKTLYHVTTAEAAKDISKRGFDPKSTIDYKYYSDMGREGVYFYDNMRQSQTYAYFLRSKKPKDQLVLVTVRAPEEILATTDRLEDGYFVSRENLGRVTVKSIKPINRVSDMY